VAGWDVSKLVPGVGQAVRRGFRQQRARDYRRSLRTGQRAVRAESVARQPVNSAYRRHDVDRFLVLDFVRVYVT
jgi:hypothetical protein